MSPLSLEDRKQHRCFGKTAIVKIVIPIPRRKERKLIPPNKTTEIGESGESGVNSHVSSVAVELSITINVVVPQDAFTMISELFLSMENCKYGEMHFNLSCPCTLNAVGSSNELQFFPGI